MNIKISLCLEMLGVFIAVTIIAAFSNTLVSMGSNLPIKIVLTLLVYIVIALIPIIIYRIKKSPFSDFGFKKAKLVKQILIALGISSATVLCFTILPLLFGITKSDVLSFKASSPSILVFYIIYTLIFVGLGEEIVFRGYFYSRISTVANSELKAVILSSILFGLWHYPNGHDILKVIMTCIMGLIYGFAKYKIKHCTLLSVSIAHGMHDAAIVIFSYLLL